MRKLLVLLAASVCLHAQNTAPVYFPGQHWRTATPESQGIDSAGLSAALAEITGKHLGVHSLLVIRHGYLVMDAYIYPYNSGTPHDLASVTKTITSTLTGVAVGQGLLKLEQPALSFFPKEAPANPEETKQKITVGNLLKMDTGLDCGYKPGEQELEGMKRSANWVQYALALPMKYAPGEKTSYCSPGYHLLAAVLGAAARQTELDYARKNLFTPLDIRDVVWADDPQGRSHGWGDSHLYPQDVAKLGYLYLHGGQWKGRQVVPADWVTMSLMPVGQGYEWNVANGPNGHQYGGTGRGGQSLIVWPDLDTIVVAMGGGNTGMIAPLVRKAVKEDATLPANATAQKDLQARIAEVLKPPAATPAAPPPALAASISGVTYEFPLNTSRLDSFALTFRGKDEARLNVKYLGQDLTFPVGLDGVYRLGSYGPLHLLGGAMGKWTSDTDFELDLNFVANINHYLLKMHFDGDQVEVQANEASGLIRNGHITGKRKG